VYDGSTGEVKDDRNQMSMLEDFWLPRREGGRGTEITTLQGGQNLGEMQDVEYFKEKLYRSLNIPQSRLMSDGGFNMGRSAEITRDEIKFTKFIQRLRKRFTALFQDMLKTQLILKGVLTPDDWDIVKEGIIYDFIDDNHFFELKDAELLKERVDQLTLMTDYVGTYFSIEWIRRNVLKQSPEDIEKIDKQIADEKAAGDIDPDAGKDVGGPEGGFGDPTRGVEQEPEYPEDEYPDADEPTNGNGISIATITIAVTISWFISIWIFIFWILRFLFHTSSWITEATFRSTHIFTSIRIYISCCLLICNLFINFFYIFR
jgi:hypothetical protein